MKFLSQITAFIFTPLLAFSAELELLSRRGAELKRATLDNSKNSWSLVTNHSGFIPRVRGVGTFSSPLKVTPEEQVEISTELKKLKVRQEFLEDLPVNRAHGEFIRLDKFEVELGGKIGKDLGSLFNKTLEREWKPLDAITYTDEKIFFWKGGALSRSALPSQLAECRWLSSHWSCEFKTGRLEIRSTK